MKQLIIYTLIILTIFVSVACNSKIEKDVEKDLFEPSLKEQKYKSNLIEFYDTVSYLAKNIL